MKQTELKFFLEEYSSRRPKFEKIGKKGECVLRDALNKSGIKYHSITPPRIKDFNSCLGKVVKKEIKKPFEEIKDFIGLRVICLFLSDLDRVEKVIDKTFEVTEREDKTNC